MSYLLGVDIGTSGTKSVLFDEDGGIIASALAEYPLYQPKNGWAEQEPEDWWNAVCVTVKQCVDKSGIDPRGIKGIGLSGQMHGLVMLDKDGKVIRRSIIWCDQRTEAQCATLTSLVGKEKLFEITANPAITGFTAAKILWVRENEPENYSHCDKILLPKDYIRYKLTGEFASDVSDASGMQLLDIAGRRWSDFVLERLEINKSMLGRVYESCEATGQLTWSAAAATGLVAGIVVAGGAGDNAAAAVGNGIISEGKISASLGTSGVVFAHMDKPTVDPLGRVHTFCTSVPGAWHIMGVTQGAGLSFKWLRDNFFTGEVQTAGLLGESPNYLLDEIAATSPAGANNLIFLPYLMGERTPHLDADCRGAFIGLSAIHTKADMLRAVLEGVIYSLNDCMGIINGMGVRPSSVTATGGGAKSALWRTIMSDVFGLDVSVAPSTEGAALGAAILGGVAGGVYKSVADGCAAAIHEGKGGTISPDESRAAKYAGMYGVYAKLYPALRDCYKLLSKS
ncbi:MAG: xylulokinase [Eubacteriales bacterium]